ncbi:MAG: hypothetical protein COC01_06780 [Bacteroidetes bacterium]|nr:MAG: hypothetical protein COC01_06780 [Bacteroidota bacterium]
MFFEDDSILRSIQIPINYKDIDLLRLRHEGYTEEELEFNKITELIDTAEQSLKRKMAAAVSNLKEYGVKYEEIEGLVKSKLHSLRNT